MGIKYFLASGKDDTFSMIDLQDFFLSFMYVARFSKGYMDFLKISAFNIISILFLPTILVFLTTFRPMHLSKWYPYFWYLKDLKGLGMYCSTFSIVKPIFTSFGIESWLNTKLYVCVTMC